MSSWTRWSGSRIAVAALFILPIATTVRAQLPNASSAAFALGGNFTAVARGFEAVAWNPANLGMPGRPGFSLGFLSIAANAGMAPIDLSTLNQFSGRLVDSVTRVRWIDQAKLAGGQSARVDAGITPIALTVGPVGFQLGSTAYTTMNLSPDAWEAVLFGNAGRSGGQAKNLDFTGTSLRTAAFTTGALSFGRELPINLTHGLVGDEHTAIGITAKYVVGHGLAVAEDLGSSFAGSDLQIRFPVITVRTDSIFGTPVPQTDYKGIAGTGLGVDLAASWSGGPWKLGFLAENVMNSFRWDTTKLAYMPGTGSFTIDSSETNFDQSPYENAPVALRQIVAAQKFPGALTFGAAMQVTRALTLTADVKKSFGGSEAITVGPRSRYGVGAEFRVLSFLPLRAGVASVTDGWQAGAGFGIHVLGFELGTAASIRQVGAARQSGFMIGLVGVGR